MTIAPEGLGQADLDTGLDVVFDDPAVDAPVEAAAPEAESPVLYRYSISYNEDGSPSRAVSQNYAEGRTARLNFDEHGKPTTTVEIDRKANTHTMTFHQAIGDVAIVSVYEGPEGWVGYSPNISRGE